VSKIRVLLVDDNAGFRQRMARLLQTQDDLEVIGEGADGTDAVSLASTLRPDVILMDFRMAGLDGFTAARSITREHPAVRVFLLTAYPGALDKDKISRSGIAGLLIKDMPAAEIFAAIRSAAASKSA
jgi:DNA-binding NarL/FixJ family response regulator